jgi:phosphoribosylglycinamide formyltransferase-1
VKRVAILISGGGSNMIELCKSMQPDHPAKPVLVMSNDPSAAGLNAAAAMGVATDSVDHRPFGKNRAAFEEVLAQKINAAGADVICLAGFMRILTEGFVSQFDDQMLNVHPSLLPKYPGLNTHARAIDAGDTEAGCTVHQVTAVLDDGPLLGQAKVPIQPDDSPETLAKRVLAKEHLLYPAVLKRFCAGDRSFLSLT